MNIEHISEGFDVFVHDGDKAIGAVRKILPHGLVIYERRRLHCAAGRHPRCAFRQGRPQGRKAGTALETSDRARPLGRRSYDYITTKRLVGPFKSHQMTLTARVADLLERDASGRRIVLERDVAK